MGNKFVVRVNKKVYHNTLRDDAALLKGIPLSNAAFCHVEAYPPFSPLTT